MQFGGLEPLFPCVTLRLPLRTLRFLLVVLPQRTQRTRKGPQSKLHHSTFALAKSNLKGWTLNYSCFRFDCGIGSQFAYNPAEIIELLLRIREKDQTGSQRITH